MSIFWRLLIDDLVSNFKDIPEGKTAGPDLGLIKSGYMPLRIGVMLDIPGTMVKVYRPCDLVHLFVHVHLYGYSRRHCAHAAYTGVRVYRLVSLDSVNVKISSRKSKRRRLLFFNLWQIATLATSAYLFSIYPYAKLYHDMRGGMLKLICFVKCGRFLIGLIEFHYDDYTLERLKEVNGINGRPLEALSLMAAYNCTPL